MSFHKAVLEWRGELIPVINPDTGEVKYFIHEEGECLLKALIRHCLKEQNNNAKTKETQVREI